VHWPLKRFTCQSRRSRRGKAISQLTVRASGQRSAEPYSQPESSASVLQDHHRAVSVDSSSKVIDEQLLPAWGDAFRIGNVEAATPRFAGHGSWQTISWNAAGMTSTSRSVDLVERATQRDRGLALRLGEAHAQYRDGRNLYKTSPPRQKLSVVRGIRDSFRTADDVFAIRPWKYLPRRTLYLGRLSSCDAGDHPSD